MQKHLGYFAKQLFTNFLKVKLCLVVDTLPVFVNIRRRYRMG